MRVPKSRPRAEQGQADLFSDLMPTSPSAPTPPSAAGVASAGSLGSPVSPGLSGPVGTTGTAPTPPGGGGGGGVPGISGEPAYAPLYTGLGQSLTGPQDGPGADLQRRRGGPKKGLYDDLLQGGVR